MFFQKTLPLLLILASFLYAHECFHDKMNFTLKAIEDPHPSKFLKYSALDYRNININFDYTNLGNSSLDAQLVNRILPPVNSFKKTHNAIFCPTVLQFHPKGHPKYGAAHRESVKSLLEASIKVIPRTSRIMVPPNMCDQNIKIPASASYHGDIVIFVSSVDRNRVSYEAHSWPCGYESKTHRPTVGAIEFNNYYMGEKLGSSVGYESIISVALHEITHILGFSPVLYPYFINPKTLQPLTGHLFNKIVNGVNTKVLNLAPLTERLRAHFNCSTLEGAYLENEGGSGSAGSHFERRIFHNEMMTASVLLDARFSEFTLALLEGTGWYQVNYSNAEPMTYGKNKGCAFLDTKCINSTTMKPNFKEFCSPLTSTGVSWTRRGLGYCGSPHFKTDYYLNPEFDYWENKTIVRDAFSDNCPRVQPEYTHDFSSIDCEDTLQAKKCILKFAEFYGFGAKAFMGSLSSGKGSWTGITGYCFKTRCEKKEDGNYVLQVLMGPAESVVNCTAEGEIKASSFGELNLEEKLYGALQCPDPNEFCEQVETEGYCKGKCFGNGVCVEKQCKCNDGWTSYNCAERQEVHQCSRCAGDHLYTTCFGNSCICSASNLTCQGLLGKIKDEPVPYYKPEVIPYFVVDDNDDGNKGGLAKFLVPGILVLALFCLLGCFFAKKKKQVPAMQESLSRPILPKNPKESIAIL